MNFPNKNILHRQLTPDSTKELRAVLKRVLSEMLKQSCPCRYPRFRHLINFQHENYDAGPVFCADTNYLVSIARDKELDFLKLESRITENIIGDYDADYIYRCSKCGTLYKNIAKQYSIIFEFEYLIILEPKYLPDIGAELIFPIPLYQGLYGFTDEDLLRCSKEFIIGSTVEVFDYLIKRR